ncbi:hypothetical protein TSTA_056210 [Talaromyces stipitatus ATCC 10500]|uniref:Nephrocystin 3-like N-terminal domain-containing protein n=1 Tax=Talaromyces stipitatus (strain ATCC 10500 / CBS 375.48 / QM 6759 / NRRL 1006) TaxID=441959 RepID=B8MRI5_TALSN|nr:uncharacterized protein TSTA_056210 [Talaromyces stipitatus ATCC 10500]EED13122.1 hypothetical protein TSTA_056210 [Talaromyces stipitatus ATCC 10500]
MTSYFKIEHKYPENTTSYDQCRVEWGEDYIICKDGDPYTHYRTFTSGNTLIKDRKTRETIRKETDALCFEMEAAGLMADFPCLVVHGIFDYAYSHQNNNGRALLEDIKQGQNRALDQQGSSHSEKMAKLLLDSHHRCHQVFKTSTYEKFKNINPNRVEGTCEWALKSPEYQRWWNTTSNDLLWISADPGCRKSVLAKSLIDEVFAAADLTVFIVYLFFEDNDEQNSIATALCVVLHQLFSLQPQSAATRIAVLGKKLRENSV